MDFGKIVENSLSYAVNGLVSNPFKWLVLIILSLLQIIPVIGFVVFLVLSGVTMSNFWDKIPLIAGGLVGTFIGMIILNSFYQGFLVRTLKGDEVFPDLSDPALLFIDGIKLTVVQIVYFIPVVMVLLATVLIAVATSAAGEPRMDPAAMMSLIGVIILGLGIACILLVILSLFSVIGIVRFARTGQVTEAFQIGGILNTIRAIGWFNYILALIILFMTLLAYGIAMSAVQFILSLIPIIGIVFELLVTLVQLILAPLVACYLYRYMSILYDTPGNN